MFEEIKKQVLCANLALVKHQLVTFTWGNVSQITEDRKYCIIKPSGVDYDAMTADDMVVVDMNGNRVEGKYKPSSDTQTHLALYKAYDNIGGIVHTHSRWATIFAQIKKDIPCFGTTHADTFGGAIPCTKCLSAEQIAGQYEYETGVAIIECFKTRGLNPAYIQAVNVASHGPFAWGASGYEAVHNAVVMEECAMMAWHTMVGGQNETIQTELLERHFYRKHGPNAYYGQG